MVEVGVLVRAPGGARLNSLPAVSVAIDAEAFACPFDDFLAEIIVLRIEMVKLGRVIVIFELQQPRTAAAVALAQRNK